MERKLLQIAIAIMIRLPGELIVAPLSWLWQQRVARAAQRSLLT